MILALGTLPASTGLWFSNFPRLSSATRSSLCSHPSIHSLNRPVVFSAVVALHSLFDSIFHESNCKSSMKTERLQCETADGKCEHARCLGPFSKKVQHRATPPGIPPHGLQRPPEKEGQRQAAAGDTDGRAESAEEGKGLKKFTSDIFWGNDSGY